MAINFESFEESKKCKLSGGELEKEFDRIQKLARDMDTQTSDDMLIAYAYYKQATIGDNESDPPSVTDIIRTFKYNTWRRLSGMSKEDAKRNYIDFISYLMGK